MARSRKRLYQHNQIRQKAKTISLTPKQIEGATKWIDLLKSGKLVNEKPNYINFQNCILESLLGYDNIRFESDNVEFSVKDGKGNVFLAVECKGTGKGLDEHQSRKAEHSTPMKQLWDYMGGEAAWGIATNYRFFRLVKRLDGVDTYYEIDFKTLYDDSGLNTDMIAEFVYVFGHIVRNGDEDLDAGGENEDRNITNSFYGLFRNARQMMTKEFEAGGMERVEAMDAAQMFLNRLVFLFFAEDKDLIGDRRLFINHVVSSLEKGFPAEDTDVVCRGIRDDLFRVLDKGYKGIPRFNGGLFRGTTIASFKDYRDPTWFADVVSNFEAPKNAITARIMETHGKLSPIIQTIIEMRQYNFQTDVDVNILGHVFEQSIMELDAILETGKPLNKIDGIYYTPSYITDYICRQTILPYLSLSGSVQEPDELVREYAENDKMAILDKRLRDLRVLDPACGSGAFLTSAASLLLEIHEALHNTRMVNRSHVTPSGLVSFDAWSADEVIRGIVANNIYGVDKNPQSVKIAQLAMFLLTANGTEPLPDTSDHIIAGNSLISDDAVSPVALDWEKSFAGVLGGDNPGFDVIIGNPPYGAELSEDEKTYLKNEFDAGGTNTAMLFIHQSLRFLKKGGMHGFIVPKSLMFVSGGWKIARDSITGDMTELIDVGKVWDNVQLEQCIYIMRDGSCAENYACGVRDESKIAVVSQVDKRMVSLFGRFPPVLSQHEMDLGQKMATSFGRLGGHVRNTRGATVHSRHITDHGTPLIGGKQVQPYHVSGMKGYVDPAVVGNNGKIKDRTVLAQNIVAHIKEPKDHIRLTAAIPERTDYLILDTVNQLAVDDTMSPHFLLGLLSSKIINWYTYVFIYSKGIRTMHFDGIVTDNIPVQVAREDEVTERVMEMINVGNDDFRQEELVREIDCLFYDIFELSEDEVSIVQAGFE